MLNVTKVLSWRAKMKPKLIDGKWVYPCKGCKKFVKTEEAWYFKGQYHFKCLPLDKKNEIIFKLVVITGGLK